MTKLSIYITAVLASIAVPAKAAGTGVPDDGEDEYFMLMGQAEKAIQDKNYSEASQLLTEALDIDPLNPSNVLVLSNLGMVYSYMDRDSLALATLDEAHRRAPAMVTVLANRARLHLKIGNDREAYDDFSEVIRLDSVNTTARYYHGMMALYGGQLDVATADFDVLKRMAPDAYDTYSALGALYSMSGRDLEAIPYYRKLIESDPSPEYYAALAGCYLATDNLTEASTTIAEGLGFYSHDPELYYYRAWLNRERFRLDDARSDAKRAIELGADPAKVNALFGNHKVK